MNDTEGKKIDFQDIAAELEGISASLTAITRSLGEVGEQVTECALFAASSHLDRISDQLFCMDGKATETAK